MSFLILSALAHCLLCLLARCISAEIRVLVLLASLRPACSLRCICSSPLAFVSVRTKPQQHQWQPWPASKPAAHQHYKSLQSSLFLFCPADYSFGSATSPSVFSFCFPSVSAPLASPTSIKFHLLTASCSHVLTLLSGFAPLCCTL